MIWAKYVALMGESRRAYGVLERKPERKRPLGKPKCRWNDIDIIANRMGARTRLIWFRIGK
jgi:hypothetical protein